MSPTAHPDEFKWAVARIRHGHRPADVFLDVAMLVPSEDGNVYTLAKRPRRRAEYMTSRRALRRLTRTPRPRIGPRARGAGRPAGRRTRRSCARSGDSGDDGAGEPAGHHARRAAR